MTPSYSLAVTKEKTSTYLFTKSVLIANYSHCLNRPGPLASSSMSKTTLSWSGEQESVDCELIPCQVHHTGEANIELYFNPSISESSDGKHLTASFRGRPLDGVKIDLPEKFTGLLCSQEKNHNGDTDLKGVGQFNNFRLWNLDNKPSINDPAVQAIKWLELSASIHRKITEEDLKDIHLG